MRSSLEPHPQFGDRVICSIRKSLVQNSSCICKFHTQQMPNEICLQAGISHQVIMLKEQEAQVRRKSFELYQTDQLLSFGTAIKFPAPWFSHL